MNKGRPRKRIVLPGERVASAFDRLPRPHTYFYEDFGDEIRWWDNRNPGDVFDIIDKDELAIRLRAAEFLKIRVVDHLPGFCSELDKCPDHLGYW